MGEQVVGQEAADWVNKHWKEQKCPICGHAEFLIGDRLVYLSEYKGPKLVLPAGRIYPLLISTCSSCGYTMLFNAILAGVAEHEDVSDSVAADQPAEST